MYDRGAVRPRIALARGKTLLRSHKGLSVHPHEAAPFNLATSGQEVASGRRGGAERGDELSGAIQA